MEFQGTYRHILWVFMLVFAATCAEAAPTYLTYQGRIVKPNGQPLEHNNVSFLFEITSSNGSCVLYREQVDGVNMQNSNGVFDVPIGNSHSYPASPTFTVLDAFNNSGGLTCFGGTPFSSTLSSGRLLRVQFHDGTAWRLISPDSAIRSVPYAGHAESSNKLGGHLADQFVLKSEVNLGADCKSGFFLTWDASSRTFGCAADAAGAGGGLSSLNGQTGSTQTFSPLATATSYGFGSSSNVHTLTIPSASTAGVTAGTISKTEFDSFAAKQAPGSYIVTLSGDVTSSLYTAGTVTTTIANNAVTTVKVADGAITGQKLENSGVTAGTYTSVTVDAKGRVTAGGALAATDIPNLDASKITTGTLTRDVSAANVTATNIRIYDGVSQYLTMRLPSGGTGYTLNWPNAVGAAGSILQSDASGNLSWVAPPSAPVSSVAGRTGAVTLSNTDISGLGTAATRNVPSSGDAAAAEVVLGNDTRLSGSRTPSGSAGGDLSGTYPNPTVAKIQTRAMSNTAPLDGQVILWDNGNSTWTPQYVRMQDIRNAWGGTAMIPSTLCTADQTMVWSSLMDRFTCQSIGSLDAAAITTGTIGVGRLGTGTADNTKYLRGDGTWQTLSTSDATKLPLAGGQMTGDIDMNTHKIINVSNVPWTAANPGGGQNMQSLRWNNGNSQWEWFTAGAAGAGIASINSDSTSAQVLAPTASGTSYGFTTSSGTHTFSIPSAGTAGVTAGTISKTEYDSFAGKQAAGNYATALSGDVTSTGYSAGTLTTAIANNAVTTAKINDGAVTGAKLEDVSGLVAGTYPKVTVDAKGRVTTGASLAATDIPNLDAAKITTGVFPVARLATGTPDGTKFLRDDGSWAALPSLGAGYVLKTGDTMTGPLEVIATSTTPGMVSRGYGISVPGTIDLSGSLGTAASPTKVANGAEIGRVAFSGYVRNSADTADAFTELASIRARTVNGDAQGRAGGGIGFFASYFSSGSPVERMTLLPPANLGIGNTNPQVELHIGNLGGSIQIGADATANRNFYMMNNSVSALRAFDIGNGNATGGGTVLARFQNDGKVGIGVASPTERLDVGGKVKATEFCIGAACISSWPSGGSGTVTNVATGTGLTGGPITTTGTLAVDVGTSANQIPQLNGSGKLEAAVIPTNIVTTSTTLGGDLSGTLPNPTVAKLQTRAVANTAPLDGQVLLWDNGNTTWTPNYVRMQDIRNAWGGTAMIPSTLCTASQAMVWSLVTDRFTCQNISITETDPKVGANTTNYLSKWNSTALVASGISEVSGNVGIGVASASHPLEIQKNHNGETALLLRNTSTGNAAEIGILFENNAGTAGNIFSTSATYAAITAYQDRFNVIATPSVTGLTLGAENGDIRFLTTGQTERMRLTAAGDLALGATSADAKLHVAGQVKITGGSPGAGKVLTSDATGLATWTTVAAGLSHVTESATTTAPNATVPAVQLLATNAATNVDFVLSPKGTGALLAQVPDGATAGGNKRGQYAVDWQRIRWDQLGVASGDYSVIAGGDGNMASGIRSAIGGGQYNSTSADGAAITGGHNNNASGIDSSISGGIGNFATGLRAAILGGNGNTASGNTSVAMGDFTTAAGSFSLSANSRTTANAYGQSTFGAWNMPAGTENATSWVNTDPLFVVGNGTGSGASRSNALMILKNGNVGLGVNSPAVKLEVAGQIKITGGTPGNGKVLTSDGTGLATWQTPSGGSGTVTSITAGTGLTGGTITGSGTIGLGTELTGLNGLSTTGFVKRTGSGTYSTVSSVTLTSEVTGVLPVANGGTNSSTALNNNRLMASVSGAIQELGAMTDGQVVVGKAASAPQIVTLGGDATISNTGSLTLGTGSVNSTKILDGSVGVADLNFAGTMATNTGLLVRDGTQLHNKTCSANQVLIWTVANGWSCNAAVLTELDPKVGTNTTNYVSKWNGTALVASGIFENASGNVGIGTSTPGYKLQVNNSSTSTAAVDVATSFNYTYAYPSTSSATRFIGQINGSENGNTAAITGEIIGQVNYANNSMPSALTKLSGSWSGVKNNNGAGAVTTAVAIQGQVENASTNTIATAMGLQSSVLKTSSGAITNGFGLNIGDIQATNAWSIYASDATAPSYFAGSVGIGTVTPSVKLDVVGGSAAVDNSFLIKKTNSASARYNAVEFNPWVYNSNSGAEDTSLLIATKMAGTTSNAAEFGSENFIYTPTSFDGNWTYLRRSGNNANGPWLYGEKFRGTVGSKGAVASGDDLLNIGGLGYNSSGSNNLGALISFQATEAYTNAAGGAKIYFATTPNASTSYLTRMTIDQTGFVGIGTTSPSNTLHVTQSAAGVVARFANSAGSCTLTPSSSAANWACTSDATLKENVQNISGEDALDKMLGLNAVTYTLKKGDDGARHTGYIAQNVRDVAPEFVRQDESGILQVSYTGFIPWITEGLKALHLKVKNLVDVQAAQSREIASQGQAILLLEQENRAKASEIEALKKQSEDLKIRLEKLEKHLTK